MLGDLVWLCKVSITAAAVVIAGVLLWTTSSSAAPYWAWTTDDGVQTYADSPKLVPLRYRERAEKLESHPLGEYERYTAGPDYTVEYTETPRSSRVKSGELE